MIYEALELGTEINIKQVSSNTYTITIGNYDAVTITILNKKYVLDAFYFNTVDGLKMNDYMKLDESMLTANKELIIYPKCIKKTYSVSLK